INVLCDRALLGTYVEGKGVVDRKIVNKASAEVLSAGGQDSSRRRPWLPLLAGMVVVTLLAGAAYYYQPWQYLALPVTAPAGMDTAQTGDSKVAEPVPEAPATSEPVGVAEPEVAVKPAPEIDAPVPVSLGELLQQADSTWYRGAWKALFARWQVVLPPTVKPDFCKFGSKYGLHCIVRQGDWNTLRTFDRPAILTLIRENGNRVPVFLQRMEDSNLELVIGGDLYRLQVEQVGSYWYGEYVVLTQAPPGGRLFLKAGDRDPDVAWLREQIGIAQDVKIPASDALLFDYQLQKQVLDFQRAHGLLTDGIVGKNTMLHLNTAVNRKDVPRLTGK
ncbi:MAG: peptidoglycan-binding protein, partial [Gammaproteobacteria bacterium]|nr:peptidoglycan-binding protein [Gammaproteobacteria bacterium]